MAKNWKHTKKLMEDLLCDKLKGLIPSGTSPHFFLFYRCSFTSSSAETTSGPMGSTASNLSRLAS